jgi:N-acetylglucosaminyldiphosphoundecaprenol N-acetyl-beta-D-mannosaminyltransferase
LPLKILGSRIDYLTCDEALKQIEVFLRSAVPHHVITGNTLMLLAAQEDPALRRILDEAALVVPESSGILWASRMMNAPLREFTPGIDLMMAICRMAAERGHPAFFLGGAPGVAEAAGHLLQNRFPFFELAGTHHGYFKPDEEPAILEKIRKAKPTLLFVGMGMPVQEKWIAAHLQSMGVPVVMGVGGSFDVLSGKLRRAPPLMRRAGIEWLYRLTQEPWRWRRIAQLPMFAWKVLKDKAAVSSKQ